MTNSEILADILAEMRALGALDEQCGDMIPRSQHALGLLTYADRIEAAAEREMRDVAMKHAVLPAVCITKAPPGNAAALREALSKCYQLAYEWEGNEREGIAGVEAPDSAETLFEIQSITNEALAAPPRNCDRFATAKDAEDAFFNTYFGPTDIGFWEAAFVDWLLTPAEGGAMTQKEAQNGKR